MQISKKIYTTLIIAILTISVIMTAVPMVSAEITTPPVLYETPIPPAPPTVVTTGGPVGSAVTVLGTVGAGDASPFSTVTAYWDSLSGAVLGTAAADVNGEYRIDVIIPNAVFGTHYVVVNDGESESEGAAYAVTPVFSIPPAFINTRALPGDTLDVSGSGFAASSDITITFDSTTLGTPVSITLVAPVITTDATGSFTATITVPASITTADYDTYVVTAEDADTNSATDLVDVDYYILANPASGPTGITTTISGRIEASVSYTITFNGAPIASGTTGTDGSYTATYTIPGVLSIATYPIEIVWATVNTRSTNFDVTASPTIVLGAGTGLVGEVVGITGTDFSSLADLTLFFDSTVANDTAGGFGPATFGGAIPAGTTFVVPSLAPGIYSVTVADSYGAVSTAVFFTINPTPVTTVALNGDTYYPGDRLSWTFFSTDAVTPIITVVVRDPAGSVWWNDVWTTTVTGPVTTVLYQNQLFGIDEPVELPSDCPLGTWNWTMTYSVASIPTPVTATGLFTVIPLPGLQDVLDDIADLDDTVTDGVDDILDAIDGVRGIVTATAGDVAMVMTDVGQVETLVSALDITAITNDLAIIKSDLGTLVMDVAALDAAVTAIEGDVATVDTALGTLQGTVTAIEGNTATIETDVGTLQADVTDVQAKVDQTPAWIAVVLSLVAAIAAIFAVITIRQKIAG